MNRPDPFAHREERIQLLDNCNRLFDLSKEADQGRAHPGDLQEAEKLMVAIGFAASRICNQIAQAAYEPPKEPWRMTDEEIFRLPKVNDEDQEDGD